MTEMVGTRPDDEMFLVYRQRFLGELRFERPWFGIVDPADPDAGGSVEQQLRRLEKLIAGRVRVDVKTARQCCLEHGTQDAAGCSVCVLKRAREFHLWRGGWGVAGNRNEQAEKTTRE